MDVGDGVSRTLAHQRVAHWTRDTLSGVSGSHFPQCLTVGFRRSHHQQTYGLLVASVPWHFVFRLAFKRNNPWRFIRTAGTTTSTMAVQAFFPFRAHDEHAQRRRLERFPDFLLSSRSCLLRHYDLHLFILCNADSAILEGLFREQGRTGKIRLSSLASTGRIGWEETVYVLRCCPSRCSCSPYGVTADFLQCRRYQGNAS